MTGRPGLSTGRRGAGKMNERPPVPRRPSGGEAVPITAACPECESRYQVRDELRGKPMRCPRADCRTVFVVGGDEPSPTTPEQPAGVPAESRRMTGAVGEMVPILPA